MINKFGRGLFDSTQSFFTPFDHVTLDLQQRFKIKRSKVKVTS